MAKMPKRPVKKKPVTTKKKPSLGEKIGGGATSAIQKRREIEKSLLMN